MCRFSKIEKSAKSLPPTVKVMALVNMEYIVHYVLVVCNERVVTVVFLCGK